MAVEPELDFKPKNTACHAAIPECHNGIVDVFSWKKISPEDRKVVNDLLTFMVSEASPWFAGLEPVYALKSEDGLILGTICPKFNFEGALIYSNFLISARSFFEFGGYLPIYKGYLDRGYSPLSSLFLSRCDNSWHCPFETRRYPTNLFDTSGLKITKNNLNNYCNHIWYDNVTDTHSIVVTNLIKMMKEYKNA